MSKLINLGDCFFTPEFINYIDTDDYVWEIILKNGKRILETNTNTRIAFEKAGYKLEGDNA